MNVDNNVKWRLVDCNGDIATCKRSINIPDGAAVTITVDCNTCDWCVKGSGGKKLSCGNPHIATKRPYVDNVGGLSRSVTGEGRPEWCPLNNNKGE